MGVEYSLWVVLVVIFLIRADFQRTWFWIVLDIDTEILSLFIARICEILKNSYPSEHVQLEPDFFYVTLQCQKIYFEGLLEITQKKFRMSSMCRSYRNQSIDLCCAKQLTGFCMMETEIFLLFFIHYKVIFTIDELMKDCEEIVFRIFCEICIEKSPVSLCKKWLQFRLTSVWIQFESDFNPVLILDYNLVLKFYILPSSSINPF